MNNPLNDLTEHQLLAEIVVTLRKIDKNTDHETKVEPEKKWLTIKDMMRLTGLKEKTIYNLRMRGELPFKKLGRTVLFDADIVKEIMKVKYNKIVDLSKV